MLALFCSSLVVQYNIAVIPEESSGLVLRLRDFGNFRRLFRCHISLFGNKITLSALTSSVGFQKSSSVLVHGLAAVDDIVYAKTS